MSDFRKALMITAIPIVVLSLVSAVRAIAGGGGWALLWLITVFLLLVAIGTAIVFAIKGEKRVAAGIWAGVGIGIVSLGVSCFAMPLTW